MMKEKLNSRKGFTLAELLVVVAIVAVLTAIAIPVFAGALEKSREATDLANIRSAYAELCVKHLQGDIETYADAGSGENVIEVPVKQSQENWQSAGNEETTSIATTLDGGSTEAVNIKARTNGNYSVRISEAGVVTVDDPA